MKAESIQEFLARGGQVRTLQPGSESQTATNREVMKKDSELRELRNLKAQLKQNGASDDQLQVVEEAIYRRICLLR